MILSQPIVGEALSPGTRVGDWIVGACIRAGHLTCVYEGASTEPHGERVIIREYAPARYQMARGDSAHLPLSAAEPWRRGLWSFIDDAKHLIRLTATSAFPGLAPAIALVRENGTAYLVLELIEGLPLSSMIDVEPRFDQPGLELILHPVAQGLAGAHDAGLLHRSIHPGEILVTPTGRWRVRPTLTGFCGRPDLGDLSASAGLYSAPEQFVEGEPLGPWTDIYALAATIHHCITRQLPLPPMHRGSGRYTPLADGDWPGFSRRFLAAVDTALAFEPSDRPQSIPDWLDHFSAQAPSIVRANELEDGGKDGLAESGSRQSVPARDPKVWYQPQATGAAEDESGIAGRDAGYEGAAVPEVRPAPGERRDYAVAGRPAHKEAGRGTILGLVAGAILTLALLAAAFLSGPSVVGTGEESGAASSAATDTSRQVEIDAAAAAADAFEKHAARALAYELPENAVVELLAAANRSRATYRQLLELQPAIATNRAGAADRLSAVFERAVDRLDQAQLATLRSLTVTYVEEAERRRALVSSAMPQLRNQLAALPDKVAASLADQADSGMRQLEEWRNSLIESAQSMRQVKDPTAAFSMYDEVELLFGSFDDAFDGLRSLPTRVETEEANARAQSTKVRSADRLETARPKVEEEQRTEAAAQKGPIAPVRATTPPPVHDDRSIRELTQETDRDLRSVFRDYRKLRSQLRRNYNDDDVSPASNQKYFERTEDLHRSIVRLRDLRPRIARADSQQAAATAYQRFAALRSLIESEIAGLRKALKAD